MARMAWFRFLSFVAAVSSVFPAPLEADSQARSPGVAHIVAPDGSARADFITTGATAASFWVKDRKGHFRDILLGFDDYTLYSSDKDGHPYFGPVVGRYANRIRNGEFTINGKTYETPKNEGNNTLHGGTNGFERREWKMIYHSSNTVVFTMLDPNGTNGFPGDVRTTVTYTLENRATWKVSMIARASEKTPIMLSGHHYWNLEAFQETQDLSGHHAQFMASKYIATDGKLIPTGELADVNNTPMDFRSGRVVGPSINTTAEAQYCGTDCVGYDNAWVFDNNDGKSSVMSFWSQNSGIKMDITTNQPAVQIYSCNGLWNAKTPIPRKKSQGGPSTVYDNHSCIVVEAEGYIDGINNPQWGVNQIYDATRPYVWESTYRFSTIA
ncbi:galactose mutarotase-like protein [Pluteus cervinus]|uniref:Galactose mutarotase-like protein n=1 Tax=Pluteus cervinus TaxID=181527 RepID=A0ACD3BDH7_9AGAR|nr:galactose mutarotase-like protein [Pluteus cervinus]